MKVAVNKAVQSGPWGGVNQFTSSLVEELENSGDKVVFDLADDDIDIILLLVPRRRGGSASFGQFGVLRYLFNHRSRPIPVVHRINDCDERKGTRFVNLRIRRLNSIADHTVFVGSWMENLSVRSRQNSSKASVILNGGSSRNFSANSNDWDGHGPLKLVTHHWSDNWMKGFDIYQRLDSEISSPEFRGKLEFTFIGRVHRGTSFHRTRVVAPLQGESLGAELRNHHVYITGSMNEPGSMHQVEGLMSGLPVIYRNSGSLPEYCDSLGEMFEGEDDLMAAIERMMSNYKKWRKNTLRYDNSSSKMVSSYRRLFLRLRQNLQTAAPKSPWRKAMSWVTTI